MEGLVLFNKPKGITSADVTNFFKKKTGKKVGHGGTLDPFAEGLLILGIGKYTKKLTKFLKGSRKTYIGEIFLGATSDTYDLTGKITKRKALVPTSQEIKETLKEFIGEISQAPPPFSAIKIKGVPAYKFARKGEKPEIKSRRVKIYDLEFLDLKDNVLKIKAEVGSGVYIRSLAADLGERLGCGGYLQRLLRTKIGEFELEKALSFADFESNFLEFWAKVYGRVQGVGFRYFTKRNVRKLGIKGWVKNVADGTVEVLAQGEEEKLQKLLEHLKQGPMLAQVKDLEIVFQKPKEIFDEFQVAF